MVPHLVHTECGFAVLDAVLVVGGVMGDVAIAINDTYGQIKSYFFCYVDNRTGLRKTIPF